MATTYRARLVGGPCAGQTKTLSQNEWDLGETVCKGAVYIFDGIKRPSGQLSRFDYQPGAPVPPPSATGNYAPHSVKAWGDLRKQVNTTLPTMLRNVERLRRGSLSRLSRRHRVGH